MFVEVVVTGNFPLGCVVLADTTCGVAGEVQLVSKTRKATRMQGNVRLDIYVPFAGLKGQTAYAASHDLAVFLIVPLPLKCYLD